MCECMCVLSGFQIHHHLSPRAHRHPITQTCNLLQTWNVQNGELVHSVMSSARADQWSADFLRLSPDGMFLFFCDVYCCLQPSAVCCYLDNCCTFFSIF